MPFRYRLALPDRPLEPPPDREADLQAALHVSDGFGVEVQGRPFPPAQRSESHHLLGRVEPLAERGEPGTETSQRAQTPLHRVEIATAQRRGEVVQGGDGRVEDGFGQPPYRPLRVDRHHQQADRQPDQPADRRVDEAGYGQVPYRWFQGGDEHRRGTGLCEQRAAALEQHGDDDRQHHDHAGLPGPDAEERHERVADGEPEDDPGQQLDGAAQA
ncbi:hypothetical protein O7634_15755 [Micromonospora sp. WMMD1120]|uniref:hypothetical protein n=1 Tax=Micromonospora sp. WMMD1120 TaxID=3016106 RepID=UPI0024164633|nr:hypothetical protein [Micromonospora sp. WMMD1120]MDG4808208.1 hypothetical protein [Micromonospora sp. WMMD1120]